MVSTLPAMPTTYSSMPLGILMLLEMMSGPPCKTSNPNYQQTCYSPHLHEDLVVVLLSPGPLVRDGVLQLPGQIPNVVIVTAVSHLCTCSSHVSMEFSCKVCKCTVRFYDWKSPDLPDVTLAYEDECWSPEPRRTRPSRACR